MIRYIRGVVMNFEIKGNNKKSPAIYKTLYIRQHLVDKIEKIANEHNTSVNNVIISMIESCLEDE